MFSRQILIHLEEWKRNSQRKPLILRGARQVGKTTAVNLFAGSFEQYISLNLEKPEDRNIFRRDLPFSQLVESIFFLKNKRNSVHPTLIFIDEIQNSPIAVESLRYFFEERPDLYVIAAGSLLKSLVDHTISFPVGRVEYMAVRPCSFLEFLTAKEEATAVDALKALPFPEYAHDYMIRLFNLYTFLGGMPEILATYFETSDLTGLSRHYNNLITSYLDDVEKYARNTTMRQVLRHVISSSLFHSGSRITFDRFGNSNYRSREVGEAFRTLEKAMLIQLVYPIHQTTLPVEQDYRKSPKLFVFDTGLVNYMAGIQKDLIGTADISAVYRGKIAEQMIGQELLSHQISTLSKLSFWTRESTGSQAEVDFIFPFGDKIIPVEVKSGSEGKLRSLHQFIEASSFPVGVRFWSNPMKIQTVKTVRNKSFKLLNLPFYLAGRLREVLEWAL